MSSMSPFPQSTSTEKKNIYWDLHDIFFLQTTRKWSSVFCKWKYSSALTIWILSLEYIVKTHYSIYVSFQKFTQFH